MSKTTFIYALCEPGTRIVRYIGKSNDPKKRLQGHLNLTITKKTPLGEWLRTGIRPELVVLREVPADGWEIAEERYIRLARGCQMNILNVGDGGEGVTHTPEVRAKLSAAHKGRYKPSLSQATREAIGRANRGPKHGMFGHTHSPDVCASISEGLRGQKRPGSASFFRGVFWDKQRKKWTARVISGSLTYNLGRFEDEIDAAYAVDRALVKLFGAPAKTNFPV